MYRLAWKTSAEKELRRLSREAIGHLVAIAEGLKENAFPPGVRKLAGTANTYRIRWGDYRLVYIIDGNNQVIEIVRVGHRKQAYR